MRALHGFSALDSGALQYGICCMYSVHLEHGTSGEQEQHLCVS